MKVNSTQFAAGKNHLSDVINFLSLAKIIGLNCNYAKICLFFSHSIEIEKNILKNSSEKENCAKEKVVITECIINESECIMH